MRWITYAAALAGAVLVCGAVRAAENQLTPQEKAAGWQLLFDGRSFANWEDPALQSPPGDSFIIEDGCLKAVGRARIVQDLFTKARFRDFEMEFDWKISPSGNSGVKYRIQDRVPLLTGRFARFEDQVNASLKNRPARGQEYVIGFEYQLLDNKLNPDARNGVTHQAGSLYDTFAPSTDATLPIGEFNHSRLVVKGAHVEHWLNGVKVMDGRLDAPEVAQNAEHRWGAGSPVYELLVKQPRKECPISLQNHNSDAWFRNIKVRRLD